MIPGRIELVTFNRHKISKTQHDIPEKYKVVFVDEFKFVENVICMRMFIMDVDQISELDEYEAQDFVKVIVAINSSQRVRLSQDLIHDNDIVAAHSPNCCVAQSTKVVLPNSLIHRVVFRLKLLLTESVFVFDQEVGSERWPYHQS